MQSWYFYRLFGLKTMLNELHFPHNEHFVFYVFEFQLFTKCKMNSKNYRISW